ncbi:pentapeptide repeat-containing protein [Streptomyces sp. SPB162]|uniref:pentapeptide repeat-containing protein n=1 Tax=Streptomyces sp. SPB162 TaxID=2940560 RepID=UPI0024051DBA|nr:pentapeptide repeat-containing protein [Streptomyces sp. SPB162]MDF9810770.1 uncharacterized protein YjbI with pentapeptide repeats [Streptomyces sp. SPB162]
MSGEKQAAALNAVRATLVAAFVALTGSFTYLLNRQGYFLSRRGQVADRYTKAVEQLSSDRLMARIGAINSLESILREAPSYHWAIVSTLATFLRVTTKTVTPPPVPEEDAIAAMIALARRPEGREEFRIDLSGVVLCGLDLRNRGLPGPARLRGVELTNSDLRKANLGKSADLSNAILEEANLSGIIATSAIFKRARMAGAKLTEAKLEGAQFQVAQLDGADLNMAHLNKADLTEAWLDEAQVYQTSFNCAFLTKTSFGRTDLSNCNLLRKDQLLKADLRGTTILPVLFARDPDVLAHVADCESRPRRTRPEPVD